MEQGAYRQAALIAADVHKETLLPAHKDVGALVQLIVPRMT